MFEGMKDEQIVLLAQQGDGKAEEYIIKKYMNFVRAKCHSFYLVGAESEDLLQEGMLGLFKATRDYAPEKNSSFQAFASMCVRRQMLSAIEGANRKKHNPLNSSISLSTPVHTEEGERTLGDVLCAREEDPETALIDDESERAFMERIAKQLSGFEKKVLGAYLLGKTYQEIAEELGKTEKSIDSALQRIRKKVSRIHMG